MMYSRTLIKGAGGEAIRVEDDVTGVWNSVQRLCIAWHIVSMHKYYLL